MPKLRPPPLWLALTALVAVSTGLRFWAATRIPIPWIAPDELIYAELGRSLYATGHLDLLGEPTRFFSLVTPAVAGLPLSLHDTALGYTLLKALQALAMSLAAVPVYLWGRALTTRWWAVVAAALTLAIPGLAYSGLVMTEVASYPLLVLAAWTAARAVVRPTFAAQAAMVAAALVATATRLQAAVLIAAFATAAVVVALAERRPSRVLRLWPSWAAFGLAGAAWAAWQLRHGGPASDLLGAYRAAGEVGYGAGDAARFVVYHLADVVVFTGLVPACATALLVVARPRTQDERAFLAVTWAVAAWNVALVGVFASRHVGHLAERNLFALAPLFFLGFACWLERGGPRPRVPTAVVATAAVALVVALPSGFVSAAAIPDAFTLIPLWRLRVHDPGISVELVLDAAAAAAAAALVLVPRRRLWLLPAALLVAFAAVSVSASRVVAAQATFGQPGTLGPVRTWIDRASPAPAVYLYSGDIYWNSVWETVFWNRRVRRVYDVPGAFVPGGIPQTPVGPRGDGVLVDRLGHPLRAPYVVASASLRLVGRVVATGRNSILLWRASQPLRLAQWIRDVRFDGTIERQASVLVYACRGGTLDLRLVAAEASTVEVRRNGSRYARRPLAAGARWSLVVPARPPLPVGSGVCVFEVVPTRPVRAELVRFEPVPIDSGKMKP